jgi:UPF0755 protein
VTERPFDQDDPSARHARPRHLRSEGRRPARARSRGRATLDERGPDLDAGHLHDDPVHDDPEHLHDDPEHFDGDHLDEEYLDEDEDFVELRPARSGARKVLLVFLVLLVAFAVLAVSAVLWVQRRIDPPGPPGEAVELEIPLGSTTEAIGRLLAEEDVIAHETVWRYYVRWQGAGPFQAGWYEFRQNSHLDDVIAVLDAGPRPPEADRFTVPEGFTVDQIVDRLADDERGLGLDADTLRGLLDSGEIRSRYQPEDQPNMEGILFPDTYEVTPDIDERAALELMVQQLDQTLAELDVESAQERFNLTPYEILIVASLIERETRIDDERPMVARVIYNRLSQGIALGIDATSCYDKNEYPCVLRVSDLESDSPYNTRRRPGLVPTPIASPGRESIAAALQPAEGPWIYYVLQDEEGNHLFTDSAAEFERGKAICRERGLGCG